MSITSLFDINYQSPSDAITTILSYAVRVCSNLNYIYIILQDWN